MILLWAKFKGYLAAIGTALAILAGVFLYGQRAGRSAAKDEQAAANAKAIKKAGDVENEIRNLDDAGVDDALGKWMASLAREELAAHRLHVAETYVSKSGLREQTEQIMGAIGAVKDAVDKMTLRVDRIVENQSKPRATRAS